MGIDRTAVLVTGGASGIGAASVRLLAESGARVYIGDLNDSGAKALATSVGEDVKALHLDVADEASWDKAIQRMSDDFGAPTVLVNSAGIFTPGGIEDVPSSELLRAFEVNQLGVFLGMQAVIDPMRSVGGGSIINVSSSAGLVGVRDAIAYSSSKWAVRGLTRSAALDLAQYGIRVNSVHPGLIDTSIFDGYPRETLDSMTSNLPFARLGRAREVAAVVRFLASDESSFCTGSEFTVDGGYACG